MVFLNSQGPAPYMDFAMPDVCNTPVGPAIVPIPYPNIALGSTAIPTQVKFLTLGMPAHNLATTIPLSNGDNGGLGLGVLSGLVMGPGAAMMGSTCLLIGGAPATKMGMPSKQNGISPNAFGSTMSPAQVKMAAMR